MNDGDLVSTVQPQLNYGGDSSSGTLDDEEDFVDDNSSTSTAGPPPDTPQSTGRFNRPWNLATAQQCGSEGNSPTSSLNTRNTANRTGSFNPFRGSNSSNQNTGTYQVRPSHTRTGSNISNSVSPMGSSIPQEFGRSFRLYSSSRHLGVGGGGGGGSGSRHREGSSFQNTFRNTMLRNMEPGASNRAGGGDGYREVSHGRCDSAAHHYGGGSVYHQRQSSLFGVPYGSSLGGSVLFYGQGADTRMNNSSIFVSGGAPLQPGMSNASFLAASISPLLGMSQSPRTQGFGAAALQVAHYAMGGGQLISSGVTPNQRDAPTLLGTLRSYLSVRGKTILVGDAAHPFEIKRGALIGSGGFAKVYVGINTCRGELVAVKEIQVVDVDDVEALREIEQEFGLLRSIRHPNIVAYYLFEHSRSQKICRIVMEFLAGDSTLHLMQKFGPLTETVLRRITRHLLDAVMYIHREGIFHRDIKPANILVSHKGDVKLCDFGCSKRISELNKATSCIIGTPVYMAPELIKGEATHKADIWSMGCTLFELATGLLPWYHSGVKDNLPLMFYITTTSESPVVLPVSQDGAAPDFSPEFLQFLEACFVRDPARRPEAAELLRHPWITGVRTGGHATHVSAGASHVEGWSPRLPANLLSLRAESQDSMAAPKPSIKSPTREMEQFSPRESQAMMSTDDSFISELAAARMSTSTAALAGSPLGIQSETAAESELQCQQELEDVSAATAIDLCNALMGFPEMAIKSLEQKLMAVDMATGTATTDVSPTNTRTFSVPPPSLMSQRGPISVSVGDFNSPSVSPEHSILHDNFHYSQAQLGASAGNFVLPSESPEAPLQQYLRISEDGNLQFATIQECESDVLGGESGLAKSVSVDSSRFVTPARHGSFSRGSPGAGGMLPHLPDRRQSPQRSAANSGYFSSPRGESPFRGVSPTAAAASASSPLPPAPPPLVSGARPSPLVQLHSTSPRPHLNVPGAGSSVGDESHSSQMHSPASVQTPRDGSFRQLPEKTKVATDGRLHMSFSVSTSPGKEMSVPLSVDVNDVRCKIVDNQPNYFVSFSDDIKGQIALRIKEAAAQSAANSPAPSVSSCATSPRGVPGNGSSSSTLADMNYSTHQRVPSASSGMHFYNTPSYRASRSPARGMSRLSSSSASHQPHLSPAAAGPAGVDDHTVLTSARTPSPASVVEGPPVVGILNTGSSSPRLPTASSNGSSKTKRSKTSGRRH